MRAEVKGIVANDIPGWPEWRSLTPEDELQWFTVSVGPTGRPSADLFQVVVATPQGNKGRRDRGPFVGLVIETFETSAVEQVIRDYVANAEGLTWEAIVESLQEIMRWEYRGLHSI
jgi:Immunity protein 8